MFLMMQLASKAILSTVGNDKQGELYIIEIQFLLASRNREVLNDYFNKVIIHSQILISLFKCIKNQLYRYIQWIVPCHTAGCRPL